MTYKEAAVRLVKAAVGTQLLPANANMRVSPTGPAPKSPAYVSPQWKWQARNPVSTDGRWVPIRSKSADGEGNTGRSTEVTAEEAREAAKEKKHKLRKRLGPLEHAFVADAAGAETLTRLGRLYQQMQLDPDNKYNTLYDQMLTSRGGNMQVVGERIQRGASRLADNATWRLVTQLDPTSSDGGVGLVGLMASIGGGDDRAAGAKRRAAEAYVKFIKRHQAKLDPAAVGTARPTPYHLGLQATLANLDSDVAGHTYMRRERPLHYWLNPLDRTGPLLELGDRMLRRLVAAQGLPESTAGRAGMNLGAFGTLGVLPLMLGGEQSQQKLRASAVNSDLYTPTTAPEQQASGSMSI